MKAMNHLRLAPAILLAGVACAGGPGAAPEYVSVAPGPQAGVDFTTRAPTPPPGAKSRTHISQTGDDGQTSELHINDDKVRVIINGREVEAPRIKRDGRHIIVLGENGEKLTTFELEGAPGAFRVAPPAPPAPPEVGFMTRTRAEAPPVMLGISFDDPGPALRHHLGLGERGAIMIEQVVEGTPASEAGLKRWDVIVSIDGSKEASGEILHDALMSHEPGDELKLWVMRGCEKKDFEVELAPYDAQKLGMAPKDVEVIEREWPTPEAFGTPSPPQAFVWRDYRDMVRGQLERRLDGEELEDAMRAMEEALGSMRFDAQGGQGYGVFEFKWDGDSHKLVIPKEMPRWSKERQEQLGQAMQLYGPKIEQRVEREAVEARERFETLQRELEQRIDRLAEEIERLSRALERSGHD